MTSEPANNPGPKALLDAPPVSSNLARFPVGWAVSEAPVSYPDALAAMDRSVEAIAHGDGPELVWLLEHPALYTAGTSARPADLLAPTRFPVYPTPRGGQYTYHGPGQRVAYVMLDLNRRCRDIRRYVHDLEAWLILALDAFGIRGEVRSDRVGVWVDRSRPGAPREDKIAAIGVRVKRWVTYHGVALNVEPTLEHFAGIVPCGITGAHLGVTSLVDLGRPVTLDDADAALRAAFAKVFGPTVDAAPPA